MKFVILKQDGEEIPYVFPDYVTHAELPMNMGFEAVAAGFVDEHTNTCVGMSVSLGLRVRPGDSQLLRNGHVKIIDNLTEDEISAAAPRGMYWKFNGEHLMFFSDGEERVRWKMLFKQMAHGLGRCAGCCHYWPK